MNYRMHSHSDRELINLYYKKYIKRSQIESYFFKKYQNTFRSISFFYLQKTYGMAIDQHDLISLSYYAIDKSMINFYKSKINYKYEYCSFLKRTFRFLVLDYIKKYLSKKHSLLNKATYISSDNDACDKQDIKKEIYNKLLIEKIFGSYFNLGPDKKKIIRI